MRQKGRALRVFCLVLVAATAFLAGVAVSKGAEPSEVTAQLRPDFVVVVDRERQTFVNANGEAVYPLLYDGTTYLPLRAVGGLMGKEVGWEEKSSTVTLGGALRESTVVERTVDGDTLVVSWRGRSEKVRLIGVDTAESVHPDAHKNTDFGKVASAYTKQALEGCAVELEFDVQQRDQYGRLLGYVYLEGELFNERLLRDGMAAVSTYPPNVKYVERFTAAQRQAQKAQAGMWEGYEEQDFGLTGEEAAAVVYVTATGKKYHSSDACGSGTYYESTLQEVLARGLTPCEKCVSP